MPGPAIARGWSSPTILLMETANALPPLAVLVSGGLDSAILLAEALRERPVVFPLSGRFGLAWEDAEGAHLRRFLGAVGTPALRPLVVLDMPVRDLYGDHWSLTGNGVPGAETP